MNKNAIVDIKTTQKLLVAEKSFKKFNAKSENLW